MRKVLVAVILLVVVALALPAAAGGRPLGATLTGAAEVPVTGDPDGSGSARVTLNQGLGEVCWDITFEDIAAPTAAHIHVGAAGGVVVPLNTSSGCIDGIAKDLIKDIRQNPSNYYVNVHNADFPGGALRGQLEK